MFSCRFLAAILAVFLLAASFISTAKADSNYYIGTEGFFDRYREPGPNLDVDVKTTYGSITAGYHNTWDNHNFMGVESRISTGTADYSSVSGEVSGAREYEGELRLLGGHGYGEDGQWRLYSGLGLRAFYDQGKGLVTNLGFFGYDRRIYQVYLPVGASYEIRMSGFSITPKVETDVLLYGRVNSRLQNLGGPSINNTQSALDGYGFRGELMIGRDMGSYAIQAGPFFRFWDMKDSDIVADPTDPASGFLEPENDRVQAGGTIRVIF